MNRRKFLTTAGLGLVAAAAPVSIDAVTRKTRRAKTAARAASGSKKLKLTFFPYELKLRHAFNLARYSRTTTPDVQVQLEYDGYVGYGEASMPPYLGESVESVTTFLNSLDPSDPLYLYSPLSISRIDSMVGTPGITYLRDHPWYF